MGDRCQICTTVFISPGQEGAVSELRKESATRAPNSLSVVNSIALKQKSSGAFVVLSMDVLKKCFK